MRTINKASITGMCFLLLISSLANAQDLKKTDQNNDKTVKYGLQIWTAVNLDVDHFRNGDAIPQAATAEEWTSAGAAGNPVWCYYENDPENGKGYGKLYNWFAINDKRGLAPEGWHIPSNADWRTLIKNLKGVDMAGTKLKSSDGWKSRKGTNAIGFTAIPSGYREPDGKFRDIGVVCQWWSNSAPVDVKPSDKIYSLMLSDRSVEVKYLQSDKGSGFSVRCEKD
jgi:uncharacterized protein (TIGR02145 family)